MNDNPAVYYRAWGDDNICYGPVELPELVRWIKEHRVGKDDWVFRDDRREWSRASELTELKPLFKSAPAGAAATGAGTEGIRPAMLRRVKILADFSEDQLLSLLKYIEAVRVAQHSCLFQKGDHGEAMFLVLEGELRARVMLQGRESTLATIGVGECIGEVAVLDQGPRSADVVANSDCLLLKISSEALKRLFREAPALAAPFLLGLGRTMVGRLRLINKRYEDSVQFARASRE